MHEVTYPAAIFDADTADIDALRAQVKAVTVHAATQERLVAELDSDLGVAIRLIGTLSDGQEDDIREMCGDDQRLAQFVRDHSIVSLASDYEVTVNIPVSITMVVTAESESDAVDMIGDVLSNEVNITVSGSSDDSWDAYDYDVVNVWEA